MCKINHSNNIVTRSMSTNLNLWKMYRILAPGLRFGLNNATPNIYLSLLIVVNLFNLLHYLIVAVCSGALPVSIKAVRVSNRVFHLDWFLLLSRFLVIYSRFICSSRLVKEHNRHKYPLCVYWPGSFKISPLRRNEDNNCCSLAIFPIK